MSINSHNHNNNSAVCHAAEFSAVAILAAAVPGDLVVDQCGRLEYYTRNRDLSYRGNNQSINTTFHHNDIPLSHIDDTTLIGTVWEVVVQIQKIQLNNKLCMAQNSQLHKTWYWPNIIFRATVTTTFMSYYSTWATRQFYLLFFRCRTNSIGCWLCRTSVRNLRR